MARLYRIEDKNGYGPYNGPNRLGYYNLHGDHQSQLRHPLPERDGINFITQDMRFGFGSIRQMNRWFNRFELRALTRHGYHFFEYEVENIIKGQCQVAFKESDIISKQRVDFPDSVV